MNDDARRRGVQSRTIVVRAHTYTQLHGGRIWAEFERGGAHDGGCHCERARSGARGWLGRGDEIKRDDGGEDFHQERGDERVAVGCCWRRQLLLTRDWATAAPTSGGRGARGCASRAAAHKVRGPRAAVVVVGGRRAASERGPAVARRWPDSLGAGEGGPSLWRPLHARRRRRAARRAAQLAAAALQLSERCVVCVPVGPAARLGCCAARCAHVLRWIWIWTRMRAGRRRRRASARQSRARPFH
jgi:hypothetical protein